MHPFSDRYPKPLLPVGNKPLIVHQIEIMKSIGIFEIFILIGHKGFEISLALGDGTQYGVKIRYVEQTETLGIAHAVGKMEAFVDRPFMLFLGDIYFVPNDLKQMVNLFLDQQQGAILAVKDEPDATAIRKNYTVQLNSEGLVKRVIEKPRHTTNRLKGVGLYLFDVTVFDAIRRTPRSAMRDEYEITDTIQVMIDDDLPVQIAKTIESDVNVSIPKDLLECNLIEAGYAPTSILIGQNVDIHPDAQLENCVIGSNVKIINPIALRNTVVFDNTLVSAKQDFDGFLLTPDFAFNCCYDYEGVSALK